MQVRKITHTNWQNFQNGELRLRNRIFLIGPNAAGKSNLMDAFKFLRDISLAKGGGFQQAVDVRGGISSIRSLSARRYSDIELQIELEEELGSPATTWGYTLAFSQDNLRRAVIKSERVVKNQQVLLQRPD